MKPRLREITIFIVHYYLFIFLILSLDVCFLKTCMHLFILSKAWMEDKFSIDSLIQHYFHPLPHLTLPPLRISIRSAASPFALAILAFRPSFMYQLFLYFQSPSLPFLSSSTTWHPFPLTWEGPHYTHLFIHFVGVDPLQVCLFRESLDMYSIVIIYTWYWL